MGLKMVDQTQDNRRAATTPGTTWHMQRCNSRRATFDSLTHARRRTPADAVRKQRPRIIQQRTSQLPIYF